MNLPFDISSENILLCIIVIIVIMVIISLYNNRSFESFKNSDYPTNVPFYNNLYNITINNTDYFRPIDTVGSQQIVLMSLLPNQNTGSQIYTNTQFIRNVQGEGCVQMNGQTIKLDKDQVVEVPADTKHSIKNTSASQRLQLNVFFTGTQFPSY